MISIFAVFCFSAIFQSGLSFTPDSLKRALVSLKSDDETHTSITETGIKRVVYQYFQERNPPDRRPHSQNRSIFSELFSSNTSLKDVFHVKYDLKCALNLSPYQKAIDEIVDGNKGTDGGDLRNRADYHFDGEKFDESNANIIDHLEMAKRAVVENRFTDARAELGRALHTAQDFYSHTNWVEMGFKQPNTGIGRKSGFGVPIAGNTTQTCKPCEDAIGECKGNVVVTDMLTSGFFRSPSPLDTAETIADGSFVEKPTGVAKCSHGGLTDLSAHQDPVGGINKDVSESINSPHGYLHHKAADLAAMTTAIIVEVFRKQIGDAIFENFLVLDQPQCDNQRSRRDVSGEKPAQKISVIPTGDISPKRAKVIHDRFNSQHPVHITSAVSDFSENPLIISIDTSVEEFLIKISAESDGKATFFLISPKNVTHKLNLNFRTGNTTDIRVQAPESGLWRLKASETQKGPFSVKMLGISIWDAIFNAMVLEGRMRHVDRPQMRTVKADEPLEPGSTLFVNVLTPDDRGTVRQLELRSMDGNLINHVPVTEPPVEDDGFSRTIFGVIVPEDPFRLVIRAADENGLDIVRSSDIVYTPKKSDQSVKIEHEIPKVDTTDIIVEENKEKSGFFSVDRNVVILTSFIIFLWLAVIVAIIFLKVAIDKCRSRGRKDISTSNIV